MSDHNPNRFDNLSTADLLAREMETRQESRALKEAVRARLIAECPIKVGHVYKVARDGFRLEGRLLLVEGVNAGIPDVMREWPFEVWAWGRLNGKSAAGDGWTIKRQNVGVQRLTLVTLNAVPGTPVMRIAS